MSDQLVAALKDPKIHKQYSKLDPVTRAVFDWRAKWLSTAHIHQIEPPGDWWAVWLLLAGRGAGKTRTAAETIGWWAWSEPDTRWLVSAPTSADVRATCFEGDSGLIKILPKEIVADYNKSYHEIRLTNGSLIKGIPASETERFRGGQYHGAWLDELAAWDYLQDAWDQIQFCVRLGKRTRIIATTTPRPKDLIVELVQKDGDDVHLTTASTYSNLANLSPTFQKQILSYEGTRLGRQEIYAELLDPEESGIIKRNMFRLWEQHMPLPKFEYILQSYDVATSEKTHNDPTACTVWGVFKPLDRPMCVMLIDCWQERLQYPDLRPKVLEEYTQSYGEEKEGKRVDLVLVEDKSAGISLIQDLQRANVFVRAYNPGRADKLQRLNIVSNVISAGRVYLPESTQRKGYVRDWVEPFVSQICSFPDTTHDDYVDSCVDSLTQITMIDGSTKAIKDVIVGDMVMTPKGARRVTAVHDNGMKEVWDIHANGHSLLATAEHRIMTDQGWKRVDTLTQSCDTVYFYQEVTSWHLKALALKLKQLFLMARNITVTLKAQTQHIANTLVGLVTGYTEMYGNSIKEKSLTDTTFTTSTATQATTTYQILNVSNVKNTGICTNSQSLISANDQNNLFTLQQFDQKLLNGISQKKAKLGTNSTQKNLWVKFGENLNLIKKQIQIASGAVICLPVRAYERFIAAQDVRRQNQNSGLVSQVMNTRTMRHVYDLTVDGEHCYYANGILVHNCTQALRYLRDVGFLDIDPQLEYDDYDEDRPKRSNPYAQ